MILMIGITDTRDQNNSEFSTLHFCVSLLLGLWRDHVWQNQAVSNSSVSGIQRNPEAKETLGKRSKGSISFIPHNTYEVCKGFVCHVGVNPPPSSAPSGCSPSVLPPHNTCSSALWQSNTWLKSERAEVLSGLLLRAALSVISRRHFTIMLFPPKTWFWLDAPPG